MPRALPDSLTPRYDEAALSLSPMFEWLKTEGQLSEQDVRRTFNGGIGMVLIAAPAEVDAILSTVSDARVIGELAAK